MKIIVFTLAWCLALPAIAGQPRSQAAKRAFVRDQACPATALHRLPCPGFRIDHKLPLDCSGPDTPANMQWLTIASHIDKSKWERSAPGCKHPTTAARPA